MKYWTNIQDTIGIGENIIFFSMIVIIVSFIFLLYGAFKKSKETPLDVLKMRYAKDDFTKEEFEEMKKDLEK